MTKYGELVKSVDTLTYLMKLLECDNEVKEELINHLQSESFLNELSDKIDNN